jgi:hypothetical protein
VSEAARDGRKAARAIHDHLTGRPGGSR